MTTDLDARIEAHNEGRSKHTAKWRPWKLVAYVAVDGEEKARALEKYFKSGSGHAFAGRRIW